MRARPAAGTWCRDRRVTRPLATSTSAQGTMTPTALHALHVRLGGHMVNFGDHALPLAYKTQGILPSHVHTRTRDCASLFDVSHMGQLVLRGPVDALIDTLERALVADVRALAPGETKYTLLTDPSGGILDDALVTLFPDWGAHVVVNAGSDKLATVLESFRRATSGRQVSMARLHERALLALQGPGAAQALASVLHRDLDRWPFMTGQTHVTLRAGPYRIDNAVVTRCGYTGEDGFELSVPAPEAETLARALLARPGVRPAGLAARDSLRLEAGLCLHAQDISRETTPVEAALMWTIPPRRRRDQTFPGARHIMAQWEHKKKDNTATKSRVGFVLPRGSPPARTGATIYDARACPIGTVTSGTFSPILKQPIGMAMMDAGAHWPVGSEAQVGIRAKRYRLTVTKMPFVPHQYYQLPKPRS